MADPTGFLGPAIDSVVGGEVLDRVGAALRSDGANGNVSLAPLTGTSTKIGRTSHRTGLVAGRALMKFGGACQLVGALPRH